MIDFLLLVLGLFMLLGGGDLMVRGASALAQNLGISSLVIGLTVVAFGTSAPELAVNTAAALKGSSEISFGNIIGSNIANIGLIIGCAALIRPLNVQGVVIAREIPMMILAACAAVIMGSDMAIRTSPDMYDRTDALILLLFFVVFLYYTISEVLHKRAEDTFVTQSAGLRAYEKRRQVWINLVSTGAGLALLIYGGKMVVSSSIDIARTLHVSEAVIGLVLVAIGTSLPELVTSLIATFKGQSDLAIGNVVGSNIFNLLFIMGITAIINPVAVPKGGLPDLIMMTVSSVILLPFAISGSRRISRKEGAALLLLYCGYMFWRTLYGIGI
ncbi:MAG: calcium/sodium antiporter [Deltaproteobacteria bacterium]|nr:calcium/sodium antiporter [Deltaproteobacteria bacterium]